MNVSKYVGDVRKCHFTIEIFQGGISEIDNGIALLKEIRKSDFSNSFKDEIEQDVEVLMFLKESVLKDIQIAMQDIEQFKKILQSIPEGMTRTYLDDFVVKNMSDKELTDKYGYQELSSIHHLKKRAYKKLRVVLEAMPLCIDSKSNDCGYRCRQEFLSQALKKIEGDMPPL